MVKNIANWNNGYNISQIPLEFDFINIFLTFKISFDISLHLSLISGLSLERIDISLVTIFTWFKQLINLV